MATTLVTLTMNTLHCDVETNSGGSNPYLWPAMVWINKNDGSVGELGILDSDSHNVLKRGMKPGDTITIETTVSQILRPFDGAEDFVIILTVALFHDNETPNDSVIAGYRAYQTTLHDSIQNHVFQLNSPDPGTVEQAKQEIGDAVNRAVTQAISDSLSLFQKGEVATGILTLDTQMGDDSTLFSTLTPQNFHLTLGDPVGGRLLLYQDFTRDGTGDVNTPKVIGQGGWQQFKFLFPGLNQVIYAVDQQGRLLRYVDASQTGGGDVSSPQVIGQGGWLQFKFLFSGGNNVIYAVDQQGRLLRYVDASQTGGGDVSSPQVIGQGGWLQFLFLFSGGNNVIYAVNPQGQLLRYVDGSQTGGGDVSSPQVIGQGGWQQFLFLFPGWENTLYAVNSDGQLLFYRDASQTGGGDVSSPGTIGQGGWQQFGFLFSGGNGMIYAAEKDLQPHHNYTIDGTMTTAIELCVAEQKAVSEATQSLAGAKQVLQNLESDFVHATASEKPAIREEINEQKQVVQDAETQLASATQALANCRNRHKPPVVIGPVPPVVRE